jgi:ribokinase
VARRDAPIDALRGLKLAVVGHVEWAEFARVPHMPRRGEIVHVSGFREDPAGGGAVSALQLAGLAGGATFFTALGDDELGHRAAHELGASGLEVRAAFRRRQPQRRVFVHLDDRSERTITVIGDRMGPRRRDRLGWNDLAEFDAVYFTAGDTGALRAARRAQVLTATARAMETLRGSGVGLDALVHSGRDTGERYRRGELDPPPELVVTTEGAKGGRWRRENRERGRYPSLEPPGPVLDTYGCGDVFAAGLTAGLGAALTLKVTLDLAARCGAWRAAGAPPYGSHEPRSRPRS